MAIYLMDCCVILLAMTAHVVTARSMKYDKAVSTSYNESWIAPRRYTPRNDTEKGRRNCKGYSNDPGGPPAREVGNLAMTAHVVTARSIKYDEAVHNYHTTLSYEISLLASTTFQFFKKNLVSFMQLVVIM